MSSVEYSSCSKGTKDHRSKEARRSTGIESNDAPPFDTRNTTQYNNSPNCILEYVYSFLISSTGRD